MINILLITLLGSIFLFDWLFWVMGVGGRIMTWIPEFVALFIAASLPFKAAFDKSIKIPFKYGLLVFAYIFHILIGFFLNDITPWVMLAGLRIYTKFIPVFLVFLFYPLSQKAFKNILLWIYALSMVQLPVVLYQRFFQYAVSGGSRSGDAIGGTLGWHSSGILAIYLLSIISFLIAFYYKDEISLPIFLISAAAALIPLTMNETKITFFLLPVSFGLPAFFTKGKQEVTVRIFFTLVILLTALTVFKVAYDYFAEKTSRESLAYFLTDENRFERYSQRRLGPLGNAVTMAPKGDLRFAFFGRGAGNVSEGFAKVLTGKYIEERHRYGSDMTFPQLMWELGFLGTILFFMFPVFVFFDSLKVSKRSGQEGAYALGMLAFSVIFMLSTFYTSTLHSNVLIFLYFFAAGQLVQLRQEADEPSIPQKVAWQQ